MEQGTLSIMEGRTIAKKDFIAHLPAGCLENKDPIYTSAIKQLLLGQTQAVLHYCFLDLLQVDKQFFFSLVHQDGAHRFKEVTKNQLWFSVLLVWGEPNTKAANSQNWKCYNFTSILLSALQSKKTEPALSTHKIHRYLV